MAALSIKTTTKITPVTEQKNIPITAQNGTVKALTIDGGGVRGYISALVLQQIELNIVKELGIEGSVNLNETNIIKDYFDVIAGTSSGSILAAAIAVGLPISRVILLYEQKAEEIFKHNWVIKGIDNVKHKLDTDKYLQNLILKGINKLKIPFQRGLGSPKHSDKGLRDVLINEIGGIKLGDVYTTLLIQSYDATNHHPVVFKTKPNKNNELEEESKHSIMRQLPLWEIVKSSASAPIYLPAHKLLSIPKQPIGKTEYYSAEYVMNDDKFKEWKIFDSAEKYEKHMKNFKGGAFLETAMIDGGIFANNPSMVAMAEIFSKYHINETLETNTKHGHQSNLKPLLVSIGSGETKTKPISIRNGRNWGGLNWVKTIIDVLMGGASSHVHNLSERVLSSNYLRFEVFLDEDISLDDSNKKTLKKMKSTTQRYLKDEVSCDLEAPSKYCFSSNMTQLIDFLKA